MRYDSEVPDKDGMGDVNEVGSGYTVADIRFR